MAAPANPSEREFGVYVRAVHGSDVGEEAAIFVALLDVEFQVDGLTLNQAAVHLAGFSPTGLRPFGPDDESPGC